MILSFRLTLTLEQPVEALCVLLARHRSLLLDPLVNYTSSSRLLLEPESPDLQ